MIELIDVSKTYGKSTVVSGVTANFQKGKITGIVGRNGSGKTVLFKMICGLVKSTTGQIRVDGKLIGKDIDFPESLGVIIETPGFLPFQSGYQNLKELALINRKIGNAEIKESIARVGLEAAGKKKVGKYSLGMRQRLGIAQAIMEDPELLILDEPMNGLDEQGVKDIRGVLAELRDKGKTILIASHNREDIEILCDEVYKMDGGILSLQQTKN